MGRFHGIASVQSKMATMLVVGGSSDFALVVCARVATGNVLETSVETAGSLANRKAMLLTDGMEEWIKHV